MHGLGLGGAMTEATDPLIEASRRYKTIQNAWSGNGRALVGNFEPVSPMV